MTRIVYASNGDKGRELGWWIHSIPEALQERVVLNNESIVWDELPPYDLGISYLYEHKVPADHWDKWVNFHPAPLPEFGGRNLAYHAIMNDAKQFGATLHYMSEQFDEGPLIEVQRFNIEPWMTAGDLVKESHKRLESMFKFWVPELVKNKGIVASFPQDRSKAKYYKKEPINDYPLVSTTMETCLNLQRKIRALTCPPNHYAKIQINGKVYRIVPEDE